MNKSKPNFFKRKFLLGFFVFVLFFSVIILPRNVYAQAVTSNPVLEMLTTLKNAWDQVQKKIKDIYQNNKDRMVKVASRTFQSTLRTTLNTVAYDTATFIFSGGEGQKPLFTTEYITEYALKAGEAASMNFIDKLNKEWQVDLCRPSFPGAQLQMGLGLVDYTGQEFYKPNCTWQTLKSNYTSYAEKWSAISDMKAEDYLAAVSNSFSPTGNDLTVALTLFDRTAGAKNEAEKKIEEQLKINKGWLEVRNAGDKAETTPAEPERQQDKLDALEKEAWGKFTGDALTDAANIFLNQSLITAIKTVQQKLAKSVAGNINESSSANFTQVNSTYTSSSGVNQVSETLKKILKPRFNVRADYDVLAELVVCADQNNPAPTNCVIDDRFSQAIQNRNSIIEAINNGYINSSWIFDRGADYTTAFNERSLMILRKFRIIPVGWEEALARAEEKTKETGRYYTLMDMISCYSPDDEYETFSSGFTQSNFANHSWCQGLIDPTWILKSNTNYCKRQGFGGYIKEKQLVDLGEDYDGDINPVIISRSDSYCADEQSCIKEKADGSCEYYGYCTEEKRTWNFGEDSCDPVYNTCESFTSNSSGKKLALLKNTINYCSADDAGCAQYSSNGTYNTSTGKILWNNSPALYFNNKIETCSSSDEGCQGFVRTASGVGHNFLVNGNFENGLTQGAWEGSGDESTIAYNGTKSISVSNPKKIEQKIKVAPDNYSIAGESYTLSFYALCTATSTVSLSSKSQDIFPSENFAYQVINYTFPSNYSSNEVYFDITTPAGATCNIDAIKLERGLSGTFYSENNTNGTVYEKIIPEYLKSLCYVNPYSSTPDYRLKLDAPEECKKYARQCNSNEIACRLFTSIYNIKIAAKAQEKDYCPEQCVGYDIYAQNKTLFEDKTVAKIIPSSATACSASYSGCTEFTNLDQLNAGGESKEYYTSLKHCIKPSQGNCQSFYSWGGTGSGYQLESYYLERDAGNLPKLTEGSLSQVPSPDNNLILEHRISGVTVCSKDIFELAVSAPGYNPDCREFYTQDGDIIYLLYSRSITCSESCKTYRMTEKNIDTSISSASACTSSNNSTAWDSTNNVCYRCLGGGRWDTSQNACLYQAIPGEGKTCPAVANNCREYNGSAGNNVRNIKSYNFNDGLNSFSGTNIFSRTESLNQGGKSLALEQTARAEVTISDIVKRDKSYVIKLLLKNTEARTMRLYFENEDSEKAYFGLLGSNENSFQAPVSSEWQLYQFNLENLNHNVSNSEKLVIEVEGSANTFISSLVISEIVERYYLIKNSWSTPEICYYDTADNYRGVNYNLGCQKYIDHTNVNHNLRQFSSMCSDSSLGCEMMVKSGTNDFVIATYDSSKLCSSANVGCTRFGKVVLSNNIISGQNIYQDVYLKNNPSRSDEITCSAENVGCDSWSSASVSGTSYFKDPGDNLCQWRKGRDANDSRFSWYKKDVKKCKSATSFTNNICLSEGDCASGQTCELDTRDFLCPVENMKTIGYGGESAIWQPKAEAGVNWAGLCPIKEAGCTEYIDPVSSFSPNIIINPNFSDMDGDGEGFDMWTAYEDEENTTCVANESCVSSTKYTQSGFEILPNKLYLLETKGDQKASIKCSNPIYELKSEDNTFSSAANNKIQVGGSNLRKLFYSANNNSSCTVNYITSEVFVVGRPAGGEDFPDDAYIQVREAVIDYQLKQNLDFTSCNGQANSSKGCVVFNQREYSQLESTSPYSRLNFNSSNYPAYSTCSGANCDANTLIKVSPDRTCGRWLSCFSYNIDQNTGEKNCLQMMECTAFNYDGSCLNFAKSPAGVRTYTSKDANASGYSLLGVEYLSNMNQVGRDEYFADDFETASLGKWYRNYQAFENSVMVSKNNQAPSVADCLVNKPNSSAISGKKVSYPASGKGFLKVGDGNCSGNFSTVEKIPLAINTQYYLSFMINTDDLASNEYASLKYIAYSSSGSVVTSTTNIIPKKNGWRDVVIEIKTEQDWDGGVVIQIASSNDKPVYFDDFRISPVLEKGESSTVNINSILSESARSGENFKMINNKFVSPTCRLYPTEDSLMCESNNKNFSANGWYGYCLQKDPKNPDVCLMWYPIDSVKGSKGSSGSSSAFTGYASTGGARPYYCAEMSADFDIVYKVEPFYSGLTYKETNNGYSESLIHSSDPSSVLGNEIGDVSGLAATMNCPYFNENNDPNQQRFPYYYWLLGAWNDPAMDDNAVKLKTTNDKKIAQDCQGACTFDSTSPSLYKGCGKATPSESWRYVRIFCSMGANSYNSSFNLPSNYSVIARDDDKTFDSSISKIVVDSGTYCSYKFTSSLDFSMPTFWKKWSKIEEEHFNLNTNTNKPALDLRIMAYNYGDQSLCKSLGGKYYDCKDTTKIKCPQTPTPRKNACLLPIDKYVPICSKVVQGEVPWSQRLKTAPYNIAAYAATSTGANSSSHDAMYFPNSYYLNTTGIPFGAVVTNGDSLNASSTVFAGSAPVEGAKYGIPYSCVDNDKTSYISGQTTENKNCSNMYFNGSKVVVAKNMTELNEAGKDGKRYTATTTGAIYQFKNILKVIWLKVSAIIGGSSYNFSNVESGQYDTVVSTTASKVSATDFKAVLPKVSNITLSPLFSSGLLNAKSKIPSTNNVYKIEKAGFYVLSFNTTVDAEQMPIKRLSVRIKSTDHISDMWVKDNAVIDLYNIDPMPDSSNPHKIVRYLQKSEEGQGYYILIKLEDNWGFYQCLGHPNSSFSESNCCKESNVFSHSSCENL